MEFLIGYLLGCGCLFPTDAELRAEAAYNLRHLRYMFACMHTLHEARNRGDIFAVRYFAVEYAFASAKLEYVNKYRELPWYKKLFLPNPDK